MYCVHCDVRIHNITLLSDVIIFRKCCILDMEIVGKSWAGKGNYVLLCLE
jgi:hypothetical protein